MPAPRWVMAFGTCAVSGGVAAGGYACGNGLDGVLPVDLYLPGCPPNPAAMIEALLMFLDRAPQRVNGGRLSNSFWRLAWSAWLTVALWPNGRAPSLARARPRSAGGDPGLVLAKLPFASRAPLLLGWGFVVLRLRTRCGHGRRHAGGDLGGVEDPGAGSSGVDLALRQFDRSRSASSGCRTWRLPGRMGGHEPRRRGDDLGEDLPRDRGQPVLFDARRLRRARCADPCLMLLAGTGRYLFCEFGNAASTMP